jgi:hypothetical protein
VPASLTNITAIAAESDGRILTLPQCSIAVSGAPISESARTGDSLRALPNRSSALRGQCQVAPDQISGLNSRLQFPGKSTRWRFSINRKVIMKLAWLVKLVVGGRQSPVSGCRALLACPESSRRCRLGSKLNSDKHLR